MQQVQWSDGLRASLPGPSVVPGERQTVFIVDDDESVRESLGPLIELEGWEARAYDCASAFLADDGAGGPCCLILDVSLPGLDGLGLQSVLAAERPEMPILFITGVGDVPMSVRAMKAGAVEFLPKPFDDGHLLAAVRIALDRSRAILAEQAALRKLRGRYETLTSREREVMARVVSGLMNKQIAWDLGISEITVKAHRGKVMRKMDSRSLAELVRMGARLDLTRPAGS